jgi:hypothetical protein
LKINAKDGAIISDDSLRILAGILSSPVDLLAFRLWSVSATFSTLICEK